MQRDNKSSTKEFLKKHKPKTRAELKKQFQDMENAKKDMTTNSTILEQNLKKFNSIEDPLLNPVNDEVLCWIRRPTSAELETLVPAELLKYQNSPEDVPQHITDKYKDFQFQMMSNLITNPKKDADWWKLNANLVFQQLFQIHLQNVMEQLGISAENF